MKPTQWVVSIGTLNLPAWSPQRLDFFLLDTFKKDRNFGAGSYQSILNGQRMFP